MEESGLINDQTGPSWHREGDRVRFGVMLPHYGRYCSREVLLDGTRRLEELGFDTVWVRDHVAWRPLRMEGADATFLDPFVTLGAVAAATSRIELGTIATIPIRHPAVVAQSFASLSFLSGRVVDASFGLGSNPAELAVAGVRVEDRAGIFLETHEICRRLWTQEHVTWHGEHFSFEDATLSPRPVQPIRTWYAGTTRGAVRRTVAAGCDGWLPARLPLATLDDRLALLRELSEDAPVPRIGMMPVFYLDEDRERARAKLDVDALVASVEGRSRWVAPPSGEFRTLEDIHGLALAGDPDDCVEGIEELRERGVDDFIFDLRLQFDRYDEVAEAIATEILPRVRTSDASPLRGGHA